MKSSKKYKKQHKTHLKIGEKVAVISGKQKGFVGVLESISKKNFQATLTGLPTRLKSIKKSKDEQTKEKEIPTYIHLSNLMAWDKTANQASRKGYKLIDEVKKQYYKKSKTLIE